MPKAANVATQKITIRLGEDVADVYAERAMKKGKQLETELIDHLERTKTYTAAQPIYLDDDARNTLSQMAGRALRTQEDVLSWAHNITSIKVAGIEVELSEQLLVRLKSRAFGKPMPEHIRRVVTEQLELFVGMR